MRRLAALVATVLVVTGTAFATSPAGAVTPTHVGLVVRYKNGSVSARCADAGRTGLAVLRSRLYVRTGTGPYAGFVVRIQGWGTLHPDAGHYWSYWHSAGGGSWTYAQNGAGSYRPRAGTVEGWSYVNGQSTAPRPRSYTYAALCGRFDRP